MGWELVVANVGDSSAFLDTGSEVLQVLIDPLLPLLYIVSSPRVLVEPPQNVSMSNISTAACCFDVMEDKAVRA